MSLLQKNLFKYKYRRANDTVDDFNRRENRMSERSIKRFSTQEYRDLFNRFAVARSSKNKEEAYKVEADISRLFTNEGI